MSGPREERCPFCGGEPVSPDCDVCGGAGTLPVMDPSLLTAARAAAPTEPPCLCKPFFSGHVAKHPDCDSEGLDVERLARALPAVFRKMLGGKPDPNYDRSIDRTWAEAIAAEYARLTKHPEEPHREDGA